MRKSLLIVGTLMLSACAPQLSLGGPKADDVLTVTKTTTPDGLALTEFGFTAGSKEVRNILMYVGGSDLKYNDSRCFVVGSGLGCQLGNVSPGTKVSVIVSGRNLSASVKYDREGSIFNYRFY